MTVFELILSDYQRYYSTGRGKANWLSIVFLTQGLWASTVYRLAHAVRCIRYKSPLHRLVDIFFIFLQKWVEIITSIELPADCEIGPGLYIGHFGPLIINGRAKLGSNCNLSQGVTIGGTHRGNRKGVPVIGNRVYIGPNAIVIGDIEIGDDVAIGAGAVVTYSTPPLAVVSGNPAKIISYEGSFEMIQYARMDQDVERITALEQRNIHSEKLQENE